MKKQASEPYPPALWRRAALLILMASVGLVISGTLMIHPPRSARPAAVDSSIPGYVHEDDTALPAGEAKAIRIAKAHLEVVNGGEPIDAYFKVGKADGGYDVLVQYVARDRFGKAHFYHGGHCLVL